MIAVAIGPGAFLRRLRPTVYLAYAPPSTTNSTPLTLLAPSEQSQTAGWAISLGSIILFMGFCSTRCWQAAGSRSLFMANMRGVRHAGTDAVDADVFLGIVQGGAFGKAADRVLSGGVGGHGVLAPQAAAGGNIYHRSPAVFSIAAISYFAAKKMSK